MLTRNVRLTIIGALLGAVLGGTAAWAIARAQEARLSPERRSGRELAIQPQVRDYVALATALIAVVRNVANLFRLGEGEARPARGA